MEQLKISDRHKNSLKDFSRGLQDTYRDELVSLMLYGSAVSGEFVDAYSNLNVLAVLKSTELPAIKKAAKLMRKFKRIKVLFLSEEYIADSTDVFPIEFLDMQENHFVLFGKDALKGIYIDMRNLRFQCEHELKVRLLALTQSYAPLASDTGALRNLLLSSFTSVLHIARNALRLKGMNPPYLKHEVLKSLASEFKIDLAVWERILSARNKKIKLAGRQIEPLFVSFVKELESLAAGIDTLGSHA